MSHWILRRAWPRPGRSTHFKITLTLLLFDLRALIIRPPSRETSIPIASVLYLITQGRDAIGYMRGMRSMKNAYAHGTAAYAILCFEKI